MTQRTMPAGLIPVGFQTSSLSNSTSVSLNSTCRGGSVFDISVETNPCRYRGDGTAPTLTTGVVLQKDVTYRFEAYNGSANLKFQRTTGTCKISIMAYRRA